MLLRFHSTVRVHIVYVCDSACVECVGVSARESVCVRIKRECANICVYLRVRVFIYTRIE